MDFKQATKRAQLARRKIEEARANGRRKALRDSVRSYFRNPAVKYEAAYRKLGVDACEEVIEAAVAGLNLFEADTSRISYWRIPKRSGGHRSICRLSPHSRMRQVILKEALERSSQLGSHIYLAKKRGRDREALAICSALASGFTFGYQADVRDAFGNTNIQQACRNTAVPASVLQNNLQFADWQFDHRAEREDAYQDNGHHIPSSSSGGPRGLIQGAASSSMVFALLLNDLPLNSQGNVRLFIYGDNLLLLTRSREERAAARACLEHYMLVHPAGPFRLTNEDVELHRGFDRMGYRYQRGITSDRIEISIDRARRYDCLARLIRLAEINARHSLPVCMGSSVVFRNLLRGCNAVSDPREIREDLRFFTREYAAEYRAELLLGVPNARQPGYDQRNMSFHGP
ncbi:hypothetical protein J2Y55_004578 [Bosea sp. BE125]|uniref:hypothetical protein n=1 Tax=Bosea sp. BE125 TaxID=2817909 RepID=UPI002858747E|nr:hypothetical protein [Bosea sp. BE125]MDR6873551.1 hypothetical protein [Bosea sp. BE125]